MYDLVVVLDENELQKRCNALIEKGDEIAKKLTGFVELKKAVEELCAKYRDFVEGLRQNLGLRQDLINNEIFECCLIVLDRAIGSWYRSRFDTEIREGLVPILNELGLWVASCIRWTREAIPPSKPLHAHLMEVTATYADRLLEALEREEKMA